jgi:hypothetical protein
MTQIFVTCFIPYSAEKRPDKNQVEWDAIHMKKVVKGEDLNGRFMFPINGVSTKIDAANVVYFRREIDRLFGARIAADHPYPVTVVPVPNGNGVVGQDNVFRTLQIANAVVENGFPGSEARDMLRWHEEMGKAHLNQRARMVDNHINALRVTCGCDKPVVLFDDFVTTGSQLAAAKIKLTEAGFNVVGVYSIFDVVGNGVRPELPGWRISERNPQRIADLFAQIPPLIRPEPTAG